MSLKTKEQTLHWSLTDSLASTRSKRKWTKCPPYTSWATKWYPWQSWWVGTHQMSHGVVLDAVASKITTSPFPGTCCGLHCPLHAAEPRAGLSLAFSLLPVTSPHVGMSSWFRLHMWGLSWVPGLAKEGSKPPAADLGLLWTRAARGSKCTWEQRTKMP